MKNSLFKSSRVFTLILITGLLLLQGCSHYSAKTKGVRSDLLSGRPDLALRNFEKQSQSSRDKVLTHLNKGMLKRMTGAYTQSNKEFEVAKKEMQYLYTTSITQAIGSAVINDAVRDYPGDRYEQILVHSYMALNYLTLGELDSARVEILQADVKMREWGETPLEDPFVRYLSGIIYEALGEYDQALVAYRNSVKVYKSTIKQHGLAVPKQLKKDLLRMLAYEGLRDELAQYESEFAMRYDRSAEKNTGSLIVILDNGLGPVKSQHTIMTWAPTVRERLKVALPRYKGRAGRTKLSQVVIDNKAYHFDTVENIDGMARKALEAEMPAITLRALARMVIKHKAAKEAEKRGGQYGSLIGAAFKIGGMISEIADTRNWSTLPQEIQLIRVPLAAGSYNAEIEIMSRGAVIDSLIHPVTIRKGRLSFISDHWVAPRPRVLKQAQAAK